MSELLQSALALAAKGLKVFPLTPGAKTPATKGWQAMATTDVDTITKLWTGHDWNIGVLCGDGLLVLDVDVKNGKTGLEELAALHLDLDSYTVQTPSGGIHVYYTGPDVPNSASRVAPGLDVRSRGGYVVGVGSVLPNGRYEHVRGTDRRSAPEKLLDRCGRTKIAGSNGVLSANGHSLPVVELDSEMAVLRARDYLQTVEAYGSYARAARLKDFGVSQDTALQLMLDHWNPRRTVPHSDEAMAEKVAHAYLYGQNAPGSASPEFLFSGVEVEAPPPVTRPDKHWFRHGDAWSKEVNWLYYETLPAMGVAVIVGPPNSGKTFVELELARSLGTGKPFFGVEPDEKCGTVFLFAGTEGSGLPRRLAALQEDSPLPISATTVEDLSSRNALDNLMATLKEEAARMDLLFGVPLKLVVLETLSASGLLLDEQNNAEAGRAMSNLAKIALAMGLLFVTTHHPPKSGTGARGAGAITASADYVMEITREGRDTLRKIDLVKARDAEQRMLGSFTLVPVVLGQDARGRDVTSMMVSMGEPVKDLGGHPPRQMESFAGALDYVYLSAAEVVEGESVAPIDLVRDEFKERTTGSKDRANLNKAFQKCVDFAVQTGAVQSRAILGVHYLIRKDFT